MRLDAVASSAAMQGNKKRRLVFCPKFNPNSVVFFFEKGNSQTSWSVRDYSAPGRPTLRYAHDFTEPLSLLMDSFKLEIDAPVCDTNNWNFWHQLTLETNRRHGIPRAAGFHLLPAKETSDDVDLIQGENLSDQHPIYRTHAPLLLDHLPKLHILSRLHHADGHELDAKFASPRSSSALAANTFGYFCINPQFLEFAPNLSLPATYTSVEIEERLRFPWTGGRHPNLDVVAQTSTEVVAIECKRWEPFDKRPAPTFEETYWRPVWGNKMERFQAIRDALHNGQFRPQHLDARQLVKHALGLRTQARKLGKKPRLLYVYVDAFPNSIINKSSLLLHETEIAEFLTRIDGDEVVVSATTYSNLLAHWRQSSTQEVRHHAQQVQERFSL